MHQLFNKLTCPRTGHDVRCSQISSQRGVTDQELFMHESQNLAPPIAYAIYTGDGRTIQLSEACQCDSRYTTTVYWTDMAGELGRGFACQSCRRIVRNERNP